MTYNHLKAKYLRITLALFSLVVAVLPLSARTVGPKRGHLYSDKSIDELVERGREFYRANQIDSAYVYWAIASEYDEKGLTDKQLGLKVNSLNNQGIVNAFYYLDYAKAYDCFIRALEDAERHDLRESQCIIYINLSQLLSMYAERMDTDVARLRVLETTKKGFDLAYKEKFYEIMAVLLSNQLLTDPSTPLDGFRAIFNKDIDTGVPCVVYVRQLYRAIEKYQKGDLGDALVDMKSVLSHIDSSWNPEMTEIETIALMSRISQEKGDNAQAWSYARQALEKARTAGTVNHELNLLNQLSEIPGDSSVYYRNLYLQKSDSVMRSGRLMLVNDLEHLRSIDQERRITRRVIHSRDMLAIGVGVMTLLLLVVVALLFWLRRKNRELQQSYEHIYRGIRASIEQESGRGATGSSSTSGVAPEPSGAEREEGGEDADNRESRRKLSNERFAELSEKIGAVLADTATVCSEEFSLSSLTSAVGSNSSFVSHVINEKYGCSFSVLVNKLRVKEACARMGDHDSWGNFTIEAIARSVGFASRSAFTTAFKRNTGMSPSQYRKIAEKDQLNN